MLVEVIASNQGCTLKFGNLNSSYTNQTLSGKAQSLPVEDHGNKRAEVSTAVSKAQSFINFKIWYKPCANVSHYKKIGDRRESKLFLEEIENSSLWILHHLVRSYDLYLGISLHYCFSLEQRNLSHSPSPWPFAFSLDCKITHALFHWSETEGEKITAVNCNLVLWSK